MDCAISIPVHHLYIGLQVQFRIRHLQKFSDDTAIVGCVGDCQDEEYRGLVDCLVKWCGENHLQLNTVKTK